MSKRDRGPFNHEKTTVDRPNPLPPENEVTRKAVAMEPDATTVPGGQQSNESEPQRSTKLMERKPREPSAFPESTGPRPFPDTVTPKLVELSAKLDQQLNTALDMMGTLRKGAKETEVHRQELLSEARAVNNNYKQLVDKLVASRDALSKELNQKERQLREAEDELRSEKARITELEFQLTETLASRDRIAERVRQVEENLEQSILPLREELDRTRAREAQVRMELDAAAKEIEGLKLLAGGPPIRK